MEYEKILSCLCAYDKRNPYYIEEYMPLNKKGEDYCNCDNCFYGRTQLAEYIIQLLNNKNQKS